MLARVMFPASSGAQQVLLLFFLYAGCFILSLPLGAPRHVPAAASPTSFSFDFSNSSSYDRRDLLFEGSTTVNGDLIDLTCDSLGLKSIGNCKGRMSYAHPVPFYDSATGMVASFATRFTFTIVLPAQQLKKGDGMTFFLTGYPSALPLDSNGSGLGLADRYQGIAYGADRFVAVEFDTYNNTFDPQESWDHIGVDLSSVTYSVNTTSLPSFSLSGAMTAFINFTSSTRMLVTRLHFDDHPYVQPVEVSAQLPDPVTSLLPPEVAVGFSAATGANAELHQILSWSFNSVLAPKKAIGKGLITAEVIVGVAVLLGGVWFFLSWFMWNRGLDSLMAGTGPRRFRYRDLAHATKNFSKERKLGEGAFGAVYLGKSFKVDHNSQQPQDVAIKEIFKGSSGGTKEFLAEVNTISRTKHKNLVRLEGWCCCRKSIWNLMCWCCLKQDDQKLFLVYELMSRGDLEYHLHKKEIALSWPTRYGIVKGIASALVYLHHACDPYILHRDIKPGNILLDDNYNAKLGDFGLSRIANKSNATLVTTAVGTMAYMDPQCIKDGDVRYNPSTDVYSFGLVLLDIACARRKSREEVSDLYRTKGATAFMVDDVADQRLGGNFDRKQICRVIEVGMLCSLPDGAQRPSMLEALQLLEHIDMSLPDRASYASSS